MNYIFRRRAGTKISLALLTIFMLLMLFSPAVSAQSLGDVNNDGFINIRDVVLVQRHILGYQPPLTTTQLTAADVNGDGLVNVVDVSLIMQYIQGYISSFPAHSLHAPVLISPVNNTAITSSAVLFRWNAVTGATRYQLEVLRGTESVPFKNVMLGNITMSEQFGFLRDGTQYRWRVRAGNTNAWGAWSAYFTLTSGNVPVAPKLSSPANNANAAGTQISFQWNAVAGANKYELEVVDERNGAFIAKALLGGDVTSSLQRGFPDDASKYKWRVKAGSAEGWGPWSGYWYFVNGNLPDGPILLQPTNNQNIASDRITFEWKPVPGADRYELVIHKGGQLFRSVPLGNVGATREYGFPNDGSTFTWTVRAGNSNGMNTASSQERTFINGSPYALPTLLTPQAFASINADPIVFSWNAVTGANQYQVEVINVRFGTSVFINTGSSTSTTQSGFSYTDGSQYRWRVRAGDGSNWGAWSASRDFITETIPNPNLPAPSLLSPADRATAGGDTVAFRCTLNSAATHYQFQVVRFNGGQIFKDVVNPPYHSDSQSFRISDFPDDGTVFMWRARLGNASGWGSWSFYRTFANGAYWWQP
jgi:hypothetical protein